MTVTAEICPYDTIQTVTVHSILLNISLWETEVDSKMQREKESMKPDEFDTMKCKSCGHVLKEHYHLKFGGYSCSGNNGDCMCVSFMK